MNIDENTINTRKCNTIEHFKAGDSNSHLSTETLKKNTAETVRINFVRILYNSQRFTATKQMQDQEKGKLNNGRRALWQFYLILTHFLLAGEKTVLQMAASVPRGEPWSLVSEQTLLTNCCVCLRGYLSN